MNDPRPPWPERALQLAEWWSQWGTCAGIHTGAVVFDRDWHPLVNGFNGAPRKQPHCQGLPRLLDKNGHCLRCRHAEKNCITQAARRGVSLERTTLYTTHRPCIRCCLDIADSGIVLVTYRHDYDSDHLRQEALDVLERAGVGYTQLGAA